MRENKNVILVMFFCFAISSVKAQQEAQYTQYMYNTSSINPAYIGSKENLNITALHRSQWVGLEGAPKTQTLAISAPIDYDKRLSLGLSVINDVAGITDETYFNIDFSYNIPFGEYAKLSFGLKAVGHLLNVDFQKLSIFDGNDVNFQENISNEFTPNIGTGVYYNTDKFYVGLSVPNLLETSFFNKTDTNEGNADSLSILRDRMHFYWITGYVFDLNDYVKFKPAVLTKLVVGAPLQVDISGNFLLYDKLSLGVAYRWSASVSALVGFRVFQPLMVGFAYDRETTALGNTKFNDGSFEVVLRYQLPEKIFGKRRLTPRFF
nr:type IX secretion system membrane protein PorP/SprF [uncultured Allomuricauda sp.]